MNELILQWTEADLLRTQTIREDQPSKHPGTVRIGRDPTQCDIVFSDQYPENHTISRLHVEILFKSPWNRFYLRNLQPKNPPLIDGGQLIQGEIALNSGCVIHLGQVQLEVVSITQTTPKVTILVPPQASVLASPSPSPHPSQPQPSLTPTTPRNLTYAIECPNCHLTLPLDARNSSCTRCGHFLADAESILVPAVQSSQSR